MLPIKKILKAVKQPSLYFVGFFLLAISVWTNKFFGRVSVDQVIYTFIFSLSGSTKGDPIFLKRFITWCVYIPCALTCLMLIIKKLITPLQRKYKPYRWLLMVAIVHMAYQFQLYDFVRGYTGPDYFKSHYHDPKLLHFTSQHPKNLVLIYVESLETTYADKKLFKYDLLKQLNQLRDEGISFPHYHQVPGTSWSIAGIVATQCGIPLKSLSIFTANKQGQLMNHFLPNAKCLPDILAEKGYQNIFINGSSLAFGGLDIFLQEHHYHERMGKEEWLASGVVQPSDMPSWGLSDDQLMAQAKIKLASLMQQNKPFNLTIFTINTHGPFGTLNRSCRKAGYHDFEGIVTCTANEVADFVRYIKSHGWLDKITVVVVGDHLAMENPVSKKLAQKKHRYAFNMLLSEQLLHANTNTIVPFDMFPTILDALNIRYEGNHVALGYSALWPHQAVEAEQRILTMQRHLGNHSRIYNHLWDQS